MKKESSDQVLLDVNVLLALAWPSHQFHITARQRLAHASVRWATCALTELAFVRLFVTPAVVGVPKPVQEALATLALMVADPRHRYWADLPALNSARTHAAFEHVLGHRQVTDAYLLDLALRHHSRLLTFDRRLLSLAHVPTAVEVLAAS